MHPVMCPVSLVSGTLVAAAPVMFVKCFKHVFAVLSECLQM